MKSLKLLVVSYLALGLAVSPLYPEIAAAKNNQTKYVAIDSKKDLNQILMNSVFLKGANDKNIASQLVKKTRRISGVALSNTRASNNEIAKKYKSQLTSRGASCLRRLKTNVSTMSNGTQAVLCGKDTLLLAMKGRMDVAGMQGMVQADNNAEPQPTIFIIDDIIEIGIVLVAGAALAVIMTDSNNDEIKKGSLAEAILESTNDVMAGPCGPGQTPGPDGLCGDLQ